MSDIFFSKKDQRKITPFVGQELLYDYISGSLDPDRIKAIEELIATSGEIQQEIKTLSSAINYVESLGQTDISDILLEQIKSPTSYIQGLLQKIKFGEWPDGVKLAMEVLVVATMVVSLVIAIPWNRVFHSRWGQSGDMTLTEVTKGYIPPPTSENRPGDKEATFQDETTKAPVVAATTTTPTPAPVAGKPVEAKPTVAVASAEATPKPVPSQGYLYRGVISVTNLTVTTEKFVEKITELGGRKAGEVQLGWKKPEGSYFHFTIPEAKYDMLMAYLNEYGKIKIQKEKHERVMPDGIIRLIITVSEQKKKDK